MNIKDVVKEGVEVSLIHDQVFTILTPSFKKQLDQFLNRYSATIQQESSQTIPFLEYHQLPFSNAAKGEQWKFRRSSYQVVRSLLSESSSQNILEISGWNGWLTHHLVSWGHTVVSCDIFPDEVTGLSAKKHYKQQWLAIQADTSNLDFFKVKFDVIIVNHCLAYMEYPASFVSELQTLLSENGKIILLGLAVFKDSSRKANETEQFKHHYKEKYGFNIFLRPTKGYLDSQDQVQLQHLGFKFFKYPDYKLRNLLCAIVSTKPKYLYGVYTCLT